MGGCPLRENRGWLPSNGKVGRRKSKTLQILICNEVFGAALWAAVLSSPGKEGGRKSKTLKPPPTAWSENRDRDARDFGSPSGPNFMRGPEGLVRACHTL
jgi:hypothetical protein